MGKLLMNMSDFIGYISKYGEKTAYRYIENEKIYDVTYNELVLRSKSIASYFIRKNYRNRHIALLGSTSCAWIECYFGILLSGNVAVPLDKMLPSDEICNLLRMGDVQTLFYSEEFSDMIQFYKEDAPGTEEFIRLSGNIFSEMTSTPHEEMPEIKPTQLAELIFTSGTTGVSKGVMLSHVNLVANAVVTVEGRFNFKVMMSVLPIHHTFELTLDNLAMLYAGACISINDKLENIVKNMELFKPTHILVVPMMVEMFWKKIQEGLKDPETKKKFELGVSLCNAAHRIGVYPEKKVFAQIHEKFGGQLECIIAGGAPLRDEVVEGFEKIGIKVYQGYGLTENAPLISVNSPRKGSKLGSVGKPFSVVKTRIQDGEIQVRGVCKMLGYYKNPEATAEVITEDGWLRTGDLGYIDDDGFIYITGRKKNLIILSNGKNIYPEELEEHMYTIEGVKDAMIYDKNDKICAMIQLLPNAEKDSVMNQIKELNDRMPTYKKISNISFRNIDFPKTTTMKIKRAEVLSEINDDSQTFSPYVAPTTKREELICNIFAQTIGKSSFGINDSFFDNGGDSLSALEAATMLEIQAQDIYDYPTPKLLAQSMEESKTEIDERAENINDAIKESVVEKVDRPKNILLTGASGYLGSHILYVLSKSDVNVVCLSRNRKKLVTTLKYYFPDDYKNFKLIVKKGNIAEENLGLSKSDYEELKNSIDTVIHTAANVHHTGHYSDFESANVYGTENVIKFCMDSGAVLHHASTASVSGSGTVEQKNPHAVFDESVLDIGQNYVQNVYIHSKYKAEEKVLLARKYGLKTNIYRIGNLTWRISDGKFQKNSEENGFISRCRGISKIGVYCPELDNFNIDFTPVDMCADAFVRLVLNGEMNQIYHLFNPYTCHFRSIQKFLHCRCVSKETFEKKVMENIHDKDVAVLSFYSKIASESDNIHTSSKFTRNKLAELGFEWRKINIGYLKYMLNI